MLYDDEYALEGVLLEVPGPRSMGNGMDPDGQVHWDSVLYFVLVFVFVIVYGQGTTVRWGDCSLAVIDSLIMVRLRN